MKPCRKSNMNLKNLALMEKPTYRFNFFKLLIYINGSYRLNAIVNTEYPRTQNGISL